MKLFSKLGSVAAAAIVTGSLILPSAPVFEKAVAAPDEYHDDWLHTEGNRLYDMNGNEVWLTGCNWFGYNVGSQVFDGVWSANMHQCLNDIADRGFNLLRVPMSTEILLQWKNKDPDPMVKVNAYSNPELTLEGVEGGTIMYSFDIWNLAVKWCRENGIKIMMDIHSAETASAGHQVPVWYSSKFSEDDWVEALEWFADYYKDDDTVIAIDLKNEPHGKADEGNFAKWDDSEDLNNWKRAAERGAKAVLDINPNILIMVEGIEVYPKFDKGFDWSSPSVDYAHYGDPDAQPYYGTWWGGNFRGVKDHPMDLGKYQSQLVYSPHDYGPLVYAQSWFNKDFNSDTLMEDCWYDNWFYLVDNNISPLLMGEWGGFIDEEHDPTGDNTKWMICLRDLMIENHINHTFWCFNENSGDTGGLVYDNFGKWDEDKYELVKPALWQTESGKFISADHKIPLGKNGITVSEYYGGSSTPAPSTTTPATEKQTEAPATTVKAEITEVISGSIVYGDANCDGEVTVADAVAILQSLANPSKYPLSADGKKNADVDGSEGITASDALAIQKYDAKVVKELPLK